MKTKIVRIGNSQGVRIPKPLLDRSGLSGEVELIARDGMVLVRAAAHPRAQWADAFQKMAARGDDELPAIPRQAVSVWDDGEWAW